MKGKLIKNFLILFFLCLTWNSIYSQHNCPQCTRKWSPVFKPDGSVNFWDCSKSGDDCEIPKNTAME